MIIGIDKGHATSGSIGAVGILNEVVENRKLGDKLIKMLKDAGHTVIDVSCNTAKTQTEQLNAVTANVNKQKLDLLVSIHFNAFDNDANGTECYVYNASHPTKQKDIDLAKKMSRLVAESCGFRDRGYKEANLHVLRETKWNSVLLEVCFLDNKNDTDKYNVDKVANAMFEAITGTKAVEPAPTPTQKDTYIQLGAHEASWRVYNVAGPYTVGHEVAKLAPSKFGGLEYKVIRWIKTNEIAVIQTENFGQVAIYVASVTGAKIVTK